MWFRSVCPFQNTLHVSVTVYMCVRFNEYKVIDSFTPVPTTGSKRPSMCYYVCVIMHVKDR